MVPKGLSRSTSFLVFSGKKYAHHADIIASVGFGSILLIFLFGIRPAFRAANLQPMDVLGQSSSKTPSSWPLSLTKRLPPGIGLGIRSTFRKLKTSRCLHWPFLNGHFRWRDDDASGLYRCF